MRSENEESLVANVCRKIVETGGYAGAVVGVAEADRRKSYGSRQFFGEVPEAEDVLQASWDGPTCPIHRRVSSRIDRRWPVKSETTVSSSLGLWRAKDRPVLAVFGKRSVSFAAKRWPCSRIGGDMAFGIMALRTRLSTTLPRTRDAQAGRAVEQSPP